MATEVDAIIYIYKIWGWLKKYYLPQ